jgi:hypothetical protein
MVWEKSRFRDWGGGGCEEDMSNQIMRCRTFIYRVYLVSGSYGLMGLIQNGLIVEPKNNLHFPRGQFPLPFVVVDVFLRTFRLPPCLIIYLCLFYFWQNFLSRIYILWINIYFFISQSYYYFFLTKIK